MYAMYVEHTANTQIFSLNLSLQTFTRLANTENIRATGSYNKEAALSFFNKLEQGIGSAVNRGFGTFEKADIANRIRTIMDDSAHVDHTNRTLAPNIYTIRFSAEDFPRIREWGSPFASELCDLAVSHARAQGYSLLGAVRVTFSTLDTLSAGEYEVIPTFEQFSPSSSQPHGAPAVRPVAPPRQDMPTRITKDAAPQAVPQAQVPQAQVPQATPQARLAGIQNHLPSHQAAATGAVLEVDGVAHPLTTFPVVIGRGKEANLRVADKGVSRRHLQISYANGAFVAQDMGSTNGSLLNGSPLRAPVALVDGSVLHVGGTRLVFRLPGGSY